MIREYTSKINKLGDRLDQVADEFERELATLPPYMKRLDQNGDIIPADLADNPSLYANPPDREDE